MNETEFLCKSGELAEGQFREARTSMGDETRFLVLTRHNGEVRAWLNVCPHQGRSLNWAPDQFLTDAEGHLVCAAHGAVFECDEGRCISGPCKNASLTAVAVEESEDTIRLSPSGIPKT